MKDQFNIAKDMSNVGHHANGDYAVEITSGEDIDNAIPLIKQSLKINKNRTYIWYTQKCYGVIYGDKREKSNSI